MSSAQDEVDALFANKDRRTNHPEDDDRDSASAASDQDDSDVENANPLQDDNHRSDAQNAPANIPYKKQHSNTGPKGVIRDAQSHRDAQLKSGSVVSLYQTGAHGQIPNTAAPAVQRASNNDDDDDDDDQDDDLNANDGFMEQWRRNRLRDLQKSGSAGTGSGPNSRPGSSGVMPVDGFGYLDAVDNSGSAVVVVYIYDEYSAVSSAVERVLTKVAKRAGASGRNIKFVKLRYQEAEMEPAGVPALLAYRDGDKFAGLVPLVDEIPDDAELSVETLEHMLQRHQIL